MNINGSRDSEWKVKPIAKGWMMVVRTFNSGGEEYLGTFANRAIAEAYIETFRNAPESDRIAANRRPVKKVETRVETDSWVATDRAAA